MGGGHSSESKQQERYHQMAEQYRPECQYSAAQIGLNAKRGCTDCLGILLYFVCFALMMFVAFVSYTEGDPNRLIYGIDRQGNLCGHRTYANNGTETTPTVKLTRDGKQLTWTDMDLIVFPIPTPEVCAKQVVGMSGPTCEDLLKDALDLGICTDRCPDADEHILWYDGTEYLGKDKVSFRVALDTKETLNRCIPSQPEKLVGNLAELFGVMGSLKSGLAELREALHIVGICLGAAVLLSFLWLFILRRTVKPTVFFSLFALFVGLGFFIFVSYSNWRRSDGGFTEKLWLVLFVGGAGFLAIFLCLCVFFFKNINVACDTIEEASKIPISIPTMAIVPPIVTLLLVPIFVFHVSVALFLETVGDIDAKKIVSYYNVTNYIGNDTLPDAPPIPYLPDPGTALNQTTQLATEVTVKFLQTKDWKSYTHLYNLFMFLWSMGLINAIGYLIIALCAVFWYWSVPGDDKKPQAGVLRGIWITVRYHLGTLMIGSLIVAIIQLIRFILSRLEDRMRKISDNATIKCILSCIQCCLACFERLIKFINKNAYIMTAICGDSFCKGARRALFLLLSHAWSVIAVNFIADWVMFFGKLQIVAGTTALGWAMITQLDMAGSDKATEDAVLTLIVIAATSFLIVSVFVQVFSVCIDVVLLSFCYDLDVNNGADKPYFLPTDLQRSLDVKNMTAKHRPVQMAEVPNFRAGTPPPKGATPMEAPLMYH